MNKIQIDFSDGIPLKDKIAIDKKDKTGAKLFIGDTIIDKRNERYIIGYCYGSIALIPPMGMHTLQVADYSKYTKLNKCAVIMGKYLIIGYDNEKFFADNSKVLKTIEITNTIPQ